MDIVGFGALNVDLVYKISSELAGRLNVRGGEEGHSLYSLSELLTYLVKEKFLGKSGGGSAANIIFGLSRMGFSTGYIGKVGSDEEGDFLLSAFPEVDTSRVVRGEGRSGMVLAFQTREEKDRSMLVFPGVNDTIDTKEIDINYLNQAKILHLTSFVGERSFQAQIETLKKISPQVLVSFDGGQLYAQRGIDALLPFFQRSDVIFPSSDEVRLLTGKDYKKGAGELLALGPGIVVVTLGAQGCYILTREEEFEVPAIQVDQAEIKDTVGAGDVFAAGFLAGIIRGKSLRSCAEFATKVAAKSITGVGRENYPTRQDLAEL